ncbi:MAG: PQQ-binding-like beta-propeller repeat protein [Cytophagia bacterium]|nr:PQQ-binding-like beta-propeller repeat protein [Cytophagia bacterium]
MRTTKYGLGLLLLTVFACSDEPDSSSQFVNWDTYHGDATASHYSSLNQINKSNVSQLELAWIFNAGDFDERTQIQSNPIVIDGLLYTTTPHLDVVALNAGTGDEVWRFDPFNGNLPSGVNRGLVYWTNGDDKRILFTAGSDLMAVNAKTGELVSSFGENGKVDLRQGLDRDIGNQDILATTPGIVYKDLLILGSRVSEGQVAAPGHVRAYDIKTGEQKWIFHTIPHPGEFGYETWPEDAWQTMGGANAWSGFSLDVKRGIVFVPTGSPAFDFHGGNRHGDNLFGNTLLALNAKTGERIWHFQTIHHDVWDRDLPAQPNLLTVTHDGKKIDAVAQITKHGVVFLFDRETGKPLFEIEERPVPVSDLDNEVTAKTQPYPIKPPPFSGQVFTEDIISEVLPNSRESILEKIKGANFGHKFTAPSVEGTVIYPGFDGGADWGGAAVDPDNGMLYINASEMAWLHQMVPVNPAGEVITKGRSVYMANCAACHGADLSGQQHVFPSLIDIKSRLGKVEAQALIKNGKGRMPGYSQINDVDLKALMDFIFEEEDQSVMTWAGKALEADEELEIPYNFTGYRKLYDANGYPAMKPPWGTLNAIDLNKGEINWQIPFGEFKELTEQGIPLTGSESYGGPAVTAGGLIFIAATPDKMFKAYDKDTGELLWQYELPFAGYATPAVYEIDGKQFVVIAAGGGKLGSVSGDAYLAFALPR